MKKQSDRLDRMQFVIKNMFDDLIFDAFFTVFYIFFEFFD